ncbi:hypothetical protein E2C01_058415 [Portunus trituberculatus]|uniref:Uncharacterized protein n=1 Tax=Portunus trituberculatus TaxID=210409 RepID=A0A5B7H2L2_PORTR|nr:hypothetical protein [Portunus trituberculatus]
MRVLAWCRADGSDAMSTIKHVTFALVFFRKVLHVSATGKVQQVAAAGRAMTEVIGRCAEVAAAARSNR